MPKTVWKEEFYVAAYEYSKAGLSDVKIADALGVSIGILNKWKRTRPAFKEALKRGRALGATKGTDSFRDYVYKRLPPYLQELWEEINRCEEERNGIVRIEALLQDAGKLARQHLFVYALTHYAFNASAACRAVNISRKTMENWIRDDPDFAALVDEIHWHKGNFFEEALVGAVDRGEVAAIIFANKTFNKDRGYGTKVEVEHSGQLNHAHAVISVDDHNLPLEVRRKILETIRQKRASLETESLALEHVPVIQDDDDPDQDEE